MPCRLLRDRLVCLQPGIPDAHGVMVLEGKDFTPWFRGAPSSYDIDAARRPRSDRAPGERHLDAPWLTRRMCRSQTCSGPASGSTSCSQPRTSSPLSSCVRSSTVPRAPRPSCACLCRSTSSKPMMVTTSWLARAMARSRQDRPGDLKLGQAVWWPASAAGVFWRSPRRWQPWWRPTCTPQRWQTRAPRRARRALDEVDQVHVFLARACVLYALTPSRRCIL